MNPTVIVAIIGIEITTFIALIGVVAWAVRKEGAINAQEHRLTVLEAKAAAHEDTKIEVVRLQEQIKHLTNLIEKWFEPIDPPAAKRRRGASLTP